MGREPAERQQLVQEVRGHLDRIDTELEVQFRRMSQIQQDLDHLRAKLEQLIDDAPTPGMEKETQTARDRLFAANRNR